MIVAFDVLTLGLYTAYWWYAINRELRDLGRARDVEGLGEKPGLSLLAFVVGGLILIPRFWTVIATARRIELAQRLVGTGDKINVPAASALWILPALAGVAAQFSTLRVALGVAGISLCLLIAANVYMQLAANRIWSVVKSQPPVRELPATAAPGPDTGRPPGVRSGLLAAGYVTAVLVPPVGFIIGLVVVSRRQVGHGVAMLAISLAVLVAVLVSAGNRDQQGNPPGLRPGQEEKLLRCTQLKSSELQHCLNRALK